MTIYILVGGLEHEFHVSIYIYTGNSNPNWRTHIFQRGRSTSHQFFWRFGPHFWWFFEAARLKRMELEASFNAQAAEANPRVISTPRKPDHVGNSQCHLHTPSPSTIGIDGIWWHHFHFFLGGMFMALFYPQKATNLREVFPGAIQKDRDFRAQNHERIPSSIWNTPWGMICVNPYVHFLGVFNMNGVYLITKFGGSFEVA